MFRLSDNNGLGKELRNVVVDTLMDLMKKNPKVIALDADLAGASNFNKFEKNGVSSFIDVGISEANMMGVAAGLSLSGYIPFVHTFAPFATRRVLDQIFLSGAYSHNTINIYGSDPGFTAGFNGGTHTSYEDISSLRAIPNVVICDAADDTQMAWIIKEFSQMGSGVHYVRGNRKAVKNVYADDSTFEIGKGNILKTGDDILIVASGQLISEALTVASKLEQDGITADVIDMFTLKPFDNELILERIAGKRRVITIENHNIINGLGSAVSEVIADNGIDVPLIRIGNDDCFGQVGTPDFLQKEYGLTSDRILKQVKQLI
jgi:transketolase